MSATGQRIAIDQEGTGAVAHEVRPVRPYDTGIPANYGKEERLSRWLAYGEAVLDFLTIFTAALAVEFFAARRQSSAFSDLLHQEAFMSALAALVETLLLYANGIYGGTRSLLGIRETERTLRACAQTFLLLWPPSLLLLQPRPAHAAVLGLAVAFPPALLLAKQIWIAAARARRGARKVNIHGTNLKMYEWLPAEAMDVDDGAPSASAGPHLLLHYSFLKRAIDAFCSSLLLVMLAPLLTLVALLIRMDSPGPALFIQRRVGHNGRLFDMYKFRSMYADVPRYDFSPATSKDPRITPIGRLLRKTSLDELPQLVNVLVGDMSLVGPRPEMPFIVETYSAVQRQRLHAVPGITGLWQLSGDRVFPIHENIEYDLYYIRNRSLFLDLAILLHTLFFAMRGV